MNSNRPCENKQSRFFVNSIATRKSIGLNCSSLSQGMDEYRSDSFTGGRMAWTKRDPRVKARLGEFILSIMASPKKTSTRFRTTWIWPVAVIAVMMLLAILIGGCAHASEIITEASYYDCSSCSREGTSGICANGQPLDDSKFTCASWDYPFGTRLRITRLDRPDIFCEVEVTDRGPNKKLYNSGRKLDLSKKAFSVLAPLSCGVKMVKVERIGE